MRGYIDLASTTINKRIRERGRGEDRLESINAKQNASGPPPSKQSVEAIIRLRSSSHPVIQAKFVFTR